MNCSTIKKWLPLYAGSELDQKKISVINAHIRTCETCPRELAAYQFYYEKMKEMLSSDIVKWEESEWNNAVKSAVHASEKIQPHSSGLAPWPYRKSWAWAAMAAAALVLAIGVFKPSLLTRLTGLAPENIARIRSRPLWEGKKQPVQDILSMTMVSQETGLKIVWFLNKNFNLEEYK